MKKQHRILVLTYWSFDDALVQTYTIPYLRIIKHLAPENTEIFLVTMEKKHEECSRIANLHDPDFAVYPLPYYPFGIKAMMNWLRNLRALKKFILENAINTIHSWCTPAGMIAYILHKQTGARLIADSFEPHAEAMVENGTWKKNSSAFKILFRYEKKLAKNSDSLIAIAPGMDDYMKEKFGVSRKAYVKPACVDLSKFSHYASKDKTLIEKFNLNDKLICVYAGKFGGIYLENEVFLFFKKATEFWGDRIRFLLLTNEPKERLLKFMQEAGLQEEQFIIQFVPHSEIQKWMGLGDFALCPVKPVPTKKYCSPVKTGEYWAMGLPVIITDHISNDSALIEANNAGYVWKSLNEKEFSKSVEYIDNLLRSESAESRYARIRKLAEQFRNFSIAEKIYGEIYR